MEKLNRTESDATKLKNFGGSGGDIAHCGTGTGHRCAQERWTATCVAAAAARVLRAHVLVLVPRPGGGRSYVRQPLRGSVVPVGCHTEAVVRSSLWIPWRGEGKRGGKIGMLSECSCAWRARILDSPLVARGVRVFPFRWGAQHPDRYCSYYY